MDGRPAHLDTAPQVDEAAMIASIALELQQRFACHTVILYGSRSRGDAGPSSDFDILGIRPHPTAVVREARWQDGAYLDLFVYSEDHVANHPDELLHVAEGKLIVDLHGGGQALLDRLLSLSQAPPEPLAADEAMARRVWARKMVRRAATGDTEGHSRRHWLLFHLLEDYFALRTLRYPGPKQALAWLQAQQPQIYEMFARALAPQASLEEIASLQEAVTGG